MLKSDIVEVDGVFVGTAILLGEGPEGDRLRFFAVDDRVRPLHGRVMPTLDALQYQAARTFRAARRRTE